MAIQGSAAAIEKGTPNEYNPFAARVRGYTIVTPDMEASIHFYRDVMGHELIERGRLDGNLPSLPTAGPQGRAYALLRHNETTASEQLGVRLLEAPAGAKENRPRPSSRLTEPGFSSCNCGPTDWRSAYHNMLKHNVRTDAPPVYYWFEGQEEMPPPETYSIAFTAYGPAGEQIFVVSHPNRVENYTGLYGPLRAHTMMVLDRWPFFDFYEKALGLLPANQPGYSADPLDRYVGPEIPVFRTVPLMINAGADTYKRTLSLNLSCEVWEFRQFDPATTPVWPTDLDRTGLAMMTIVVDRLSEVRARAVKNGIAVLGEGALPTPGARSQDGFYIRGAVGELIEVIGRT